MLEIIYKYEIPLGDKPKLHLPKGGRVLSIQNQNDKICIWAIIDPSQKIIHEYELLIVGTGHQLPDLTQYTYLSSIQQGSFVWHLFHLTQLREIKPTKQKQIN